MVNKKIERKLEVKRTQIKQKDIDTVIDGFKEEMTRRLKEKGYGTYSTYHEMSGVITEEYYELIEAIHENNVYHIQNELYDMAVGVMFGLICLLAGTMENEKLREERIQKIRETFSL